MRFSIRGHIRPTDLEPVLALLMESLMDEGVEKVSDISLDFFAWGKKDRRQIVDSDGSITALTIDADALIANPEVAKLSLPEGVTIRDRPEDMEFNLLAIAAGLDD